jgi:hypothetical protein
MHDLFTFAFDRSFLSHPDSSAISLIILAKHFISNCVPCIFDQLFNMNNLFIKKYLKTEQFFHGQKIEAIMFKTFKNKELKLHIFLG